MPGNMKAGFCEMDITPSPGMEKPGGYGKAYIGKIRDPLKVRACVIDDGSEKLRDVKKMSLTGIQVTSWSMFLTNDCATEEICPNFFLINRWSIVINLPSLTMDCFGSPASFWSEGDNKYSSFLILSEACDVIAARITSFLFSLYQFADIISVGLCLLPDRSVNGKLIRTTSPHLKGVINRILFVFPEFKRRFRKFQKLKIFKFNF